MARRNAPRLPSFDDTGPHRYFVTICVDKRRTVFTSADAVVLAREQLLQTAAREHFAIHAYCFMPDHLHLLAEGTTTWADLREFVRQYKQASSFVWKEHTGTPLWQRGYYEHVLRGDEDTRLVAAYIVANPVRGGLVTTPFEYPFLGSMTLRIEDLVLSM